jgi:exodeoxyribonuclease V alpha subunit
MSVNGIIQKIIHYKEISNGGYYIIVLLNNGLKYDGFSSYKPQKYDIIEGLKLTKNLNSYDDRIRLDKIKLRLPENIEHQKDRIRCYTNDQNLFNQFEYGQQFWLNIYKFYIDSNSIEGFEMNKDLIVIYEHISQYIYSMLEPFKNILLERNIKGLTKYQLTILITDKNFGFNINTWDYKNLEKLLEIKNFGLKTIIKISIGIGAPIEYNIRLLILNWVNNNFEGHTYLSYDYELWKKYLIDDIDMRILIDNIYNKLDKNKFDMVITQMENEGLIIKIGNIIYGSEMFDKEMNIAEKLINISNSRNLLNNMNVSKDWLIKNIEFHNYLRNSNGDRIGLNHEQLNGIKNIFLNNFSILYGKAGTGKSTMIKCLIDRFGEYRKQKQIKPFKLFYLAPTAKAKYRLTDEILDVEHKQIFNAFYTLHAFNYMIKNQKENENEILSHSYINIFIIDEFSMVDVDLFNDFLEYISEYKVVLLLLGDVRQLPSIGPGLLLSKLIESNIFLTTELVNVNRNGGNITKILDKIMDGKIIKVEDSDEKKEFIWLEPKNNIKELLLNNISNGTQIITINNNTIQEYTNIIRDKLNPKKDNSSEYYIDEKILFRIGDPVVHTKNNNKEKLYNGMCGKVVDITDTSIFVIFNNRKYEYKKDSPEIKDLVPSYIITTHKSQGSEYDNIIVLLNNSILLNRNILYTALSRAKKKIILMSEPYVLTKAIKTKLKRNSLLDFMCKYFKIYDNEEEDFIEYFKNIIKCEINNTYLEEVEIRKTIYYRDLNTNLIYDINGRLFAKMISDNKFNEIVV